MRAMDEYEAEVAQMAGATVRESLRYQHLERERLEDRMRTLAGHVQELSERSCEHCGLPPKAAVRVVVI